MMGFGTPISIGRLFGVHVRLDVTLFLLAGFFMLNGLSYGGLSGVLRELTFAVLLILSVALHEFGHAAAAAVFRIHTLDVTLTFFGGYARLSAQPRGSLQEAVISFAGPATNLLLGTLLYFWLAAPDTLFASDQALLQRLAYANIFLGIFNLLPGFPLDGGHITRAILQKFMPRNRARLIVAYGGVVIGFIIVALALQSGDFGFLLLLGFLFIYIASMEVQAARSSRF
jgi:Zn-dependent protease